MAPIYRYSLTRTCTPTTYTYHVHLGEGLSGTHLPAYCCVSTGNGLHTLNRHRKGVNRAPMEKAEATEWVWSPETGPGSNHICMNTQLLVQMHHVFGKLRGKHERLMLPIMQ